MNGKVIQNAEKFNIRSRRKRRWVKAMSVLGCIVVFCTVYALILPAITMEDSTFCGRDEHIHSEECYSSKMLSCTKAEMHTHVETCYAEISTLSDGHEHNDECYTKTQGELICTISTEEIHAHTEACFNEITSYICGLEESEGHIHSEECNDEEGQLVCELEEAEGHTHDENCIEKTSEKICTLDDTHPHEHSDECYKWEENLVCEIAEEKQLTLICTEETSHEHGEECYTESAEPVLVCEIEEHEHSISCHSDVTADVEDSSVWEKTLPELTGDKRDDLLAVAYSQLGYKESVNNYIVTEDGSIKGYTRYGQWYGDAYGDWCAMYVSFCLEYAGIDSIPYNSNCQNWTETLAEMGKYHTEYSPEAGDIIFFDNDADGTSDHVGIVYGFTENGISAIEGNAGNCVCIKEYTLDDEKIIGYGVIFDEENEIVTLTGEIYTDSTFTQLADDASMITLTGAIPEDAVVKVFPVVIDMENVLCAYDISIIMPDGTLFEPDESVSVSIVSPYLILAADDEPKAVEVYYVPEDSEPEFVASSMTDEGISFEADHFSVYMVREIEVTEVSSASELKSNFNGTKTLKLKNDISINDSIQASGNVNITLDLNGKNLTYTGSGNLFEINNGSVLTIRDSAAETTAGEETSGKSLIGNLASVNYTEGKPKLTYYVTKSEVINGNLNGATAETLVEYNVTAKGAIIMSDSGKAFNVNGGTLNIESGFICGANSGKESYAVYHEYNDSSTTNLNGGYICGFRFPESDSNRWGGYADRGGALHIKKGNLNISGTVVAANSSPMHGGIYAADSTSIYMTGGVISGNEITMENTDRINDWSTTFGGAGIYMTHGNFKMSGGYITNNVVRSGDYFDGGGGIFFRGNVTATITGGYITGNESSSGGGIRTRWSDHVNITIGDAENGPFICSNLSRMAEGGGISLCENGKALIQAGYVNNNITNTPEDWGGGGVFGFTGSYLYVRNVIIAENTAGGFGGGVAGCSTGRAYISVENGGAIFENIAEGKNMSGGSSEKHEDILYGQGSPVFMSNGYQDYFCAMNSVVEGEMLGYYAFNWKGSCDGIPVKIGKDEVISSAYILGLSSEPSDEGKTAARELAKLYINGNHSNTHGGGILCNGYMLIGDVESIGLGARIALSASKELVDADGAQKPMNEKQFTFEISDANTGTVIATAYNDEQGKVEFANRLSFMKEGVYTYYIREKSDESKTDIMFDSSIYRMMVVVEENRNGYIDNFPGLTPETIPKIEYKLSNVKVERRNGGAWEEVWEDTAPNNDEKAAIPFKLTGFTSFVNAERKSLNLNVVKEWAGSKIHPDKVTVYLMRNGAQYETVELKEENGWKYTWNNLPVSENGVHYSYSVEEKPVDGYVAEYETINGGIREGYWVETDSFDINKQYIIVSSDRDNVLYVTKESRDSSFTVNDKKSVITETVTIGGKTYANAIKTNQIEDRSIYKPYHTERQENPGYLMQNIGTGTWLLAEQQAENWLKDGTIENYTSNVRYNNGNVEIQDKWSSEGHWRTIVYRDGKFNTVEAVNYTGSDKVLLYELIASPINTDTTIKITNTPAEDVTYGIDITKVSAEDEDLLLAGAEFALLEGENQLSFVKKSDGAYSLAGENSTDTTRTLITNSHGKLVIDGLAAGEYILRETKAPDGYEVIEDKTIELSAQSGKTVALTIKDELRVYRLPSTGGRGLNMYTIGGAALLIAAAAVLMMWKYNKEKLYDEK